MGEGGGGGLISAVNGLSLLFNLTFCEPVSAMGAGAVTPFVAAVTPLVAAVTPLVAAVPLGSRYCFDIYRHYYAPIIINTSGAG